MKVISMCLEAWTSLLGAKWCLQQQSQGPCTGPERLHSSHW